MMNRMNKLAKFFGVEMGQYFTVEQMGPCCLRPERYYVFRPDGLWYRSRICSTSGRATRVLEYLFEGVVKIGKRLPKQPNVLECGTCFYVPDLTKKSMTQSYKWTGDEFCKRLSEMGLVFLTREKAVKAAKAMLLSTKLIQSSSFAKAEKREAAS